MKLRLFRRHYGIHHFIREVEIPIKLKDVVLSPDNPNDDFHIKEDLILEHIPRNFLNNPETCLLTIGNKCCSTAQRHPIFFRPWAKYFDSFVLELSK
jgi:hypothetical protein